MTDIVNDRYRILKPLGQGGGKTFLAVDEKHQEKTYPTSGLCVIRQFFPRYTVHTSEQFHQESLLLAELGKHPQIPQLLSTFEQDGQQYFVQEWIDGQTLEQEFCTFADFYCRRGINALRGKE